jgi:uncharacterized membrane protein
MTRFIHPLFVALVLGTFGLLTTQPGCSKESPPGGPAATNNSTSDGFKLDVPSTRTVVESGMRKEVTITINRDGNFKEPVDLTFKMPDGVKAEASKTKFEPNDKEVVLTIEASADAKPGEASIDVTGKPQTGSPTTVSIPIEIKAAGSAAPTPAPGPAP